MRWTTTCARDSRRGTTAWAARGTRGWPRCAAHRDRLARLLGAPGGDCVVPKTSAGQGLRAILNTFDAAVVPRVVALRGEFDSIDVILREYARRGRIALSFVEARADGRFEHDDIVAAIGAPCRSGRRLGSCLQHRAASSTMSQHSSARRMRRGAGCCSTSTIRSARCRSTSSGTTSTSPSAAATSICAAVRAPVSCTCTRAISTGRCARSTSAGSRSASGFSYRRPDPPELAEGGDAFLESTPPVVTCYQARAGQRLRSRWVLRVFAHIHCEQQRRLVELLAEQGVAAKGGTPDRGAFVVVDTPLATQWCEALARARYRHRCTRSVAAVVPGRADAGRRSRRGCRARSAVSDAVRDQADEDQERCDEDGGGEDADEIT